MQNVYLLVTKLKGVPYENNHHPIRTIVYILRLS